MLRDLDMGGVIDIFLERENVDRSLFVGEVWLDAARVFHPILPDVVKRSP